jgi:predicted esterase
VKTTIEHTIATTAHGRYLVSPGASPAAPLLLGFHGYAESAEVELQRLQTIPGIDAWTVVAVQALHPFYRRTTNEVVANWMTRQNRELAIADNIHYVQNVVRSLSGPWPFIVTAGFSQGVAMAFRGAVNLDAPVRGVLACGGDIPPEIDQAALARLPAALLGRGARDDWYTAEKLAADEARLKAAGVRVQTSVFDAGHEWTAEFSEAAAQFLHRTVHDV